MESRQRQQQMDGGGGDEAGQRAGDASNPAMARRPAAPTPTPLSKKRYKKLGTVMIHESIIHCKLSVN
jgi:hypothetical protein